MAEKRKINELGCNFCHCKDFIILDEYVCHIQNTGGGGPSPPPQTAGRADLHPDLLSVNVERWNLSWVEFKVTTHWAVSAHHQYPVGGAGSQIHIPD